MRTSLRVMRLEKVVAVRGAAGACASCSKVDLAAGTGVVMQAMLLEDDEAGFHIVHCMGCATTYRGRLMDRGDRGLVLTNVTRGELPV